MRTAYIAKLIPRERDPNTPHPCTTAPSTRHSRGSASTVASAGSSPASPPWPTQPGRETSLDRKKRGPRRLAAAEHQLPQLVVYFRRRRPIASASSALPLSLSPNPASRLPSAGTPWTLTHSVLFVLALGVSQRPVSGSVCSKLAGFSRSLQGYGWPVIAPRSATAHVVCVLFSPSS